MMIRKGMRMMAAKKPEIHRLISKVNFTDANRNADQILYLVKHYVGATGGAENNCRFFYDTYRGASAHYFIDHDGSIWQCVEENDIAWHVGASSYKHRECRNSNSIGVELCVKKDKNGRWYYTEATKKAAVELFAYLADKYRIPEDHILRHYDVTGKNCGEPDVRSGNKVWSKFKKDVAVTRASAKKDAKKEPDKKETATDVDKSAAKDNAGLPYEVQTTCDVLRIRAGAGIHYRQTGKICEKTGEKRKYTVVEEQNGWGRLKSGAGWISLAFTKRVG